MKKEPLYSVSRALLVAENFRFLMKGFRHVGQALISFLSFSKVDSIERESGGLRCGQGQILPTDYEHW